MEKEIPVFTLTVGQFLELMRDELCGDLKTPAQAGCRFEPKHLVYGLRGIQELFHCSHKTAQRLKDTVIQEAVCQNGRKIVVDAEMALKLFNERRRKKCKE